MIKKRISEEREGTLYQITAGVGENGKRHVCAVFIYTINELSLFACVSVFLSHSYHISHVS